MSKFVRDGNSHYMSAHTRPGPLHGSLSDYVRDNEMLVKGDAVIQMIMQFIQAKLFCDDFVFIQDKHILSPDVKLLNEVRHYWIPFVHRTIPFVTAHGYLVFTVYTNSHGVTIPEVPDFDLLDISIRYAETTCETVVAASWKNEHNKSQLYVLNNQSPCGITPGNTMAPIDRVKPFLRQLWELIENRSVSGYINARPPIGVQFHNMATAGGADQIGNISDLMEMHTMRALEARGQDALFLERIKDVAATGHAMNFSNVSRGPVPYWAKAEERKHQPHESNMMYIPHGLVHANTQTPIFDPEYIATYTMLLENICNVFGIPYSAIFKTSGKQTSGEVEMHRTMLINTLKMWWTMYRTILTDVFRIVYGTGNHGTDNATGTKHPINVHLRSEFISSAEQVAALYNEGVISFDTFQQLRLLAVGLPSILADNSIDPPLRESLTMKETLQIKEHVAPTGADGHAKKRKSADDDKKKRTKTE